MIIIIFRIFIQQQNAPITTKMRDDHKVIPHLEPNEWEFFEMVIGVYNESFLCMKLTYTVLVMCNMFLCFGLFCENTILNNNVVINNNNNYSLVTV